MKSIIVKLTIIFALLVITNPNTAEAHSPSRNSVGFVAGSTYGFGIGYKHQFHHSPFSLQVAGFPLVTEESALITGGVSLQFALHRGDYGSTFVSLGTSVVHESNRQISQHGRTIITAGPGIGIEWLVHKNFGFVLDIPAAALFDAHEGFKSILPIPNFTMMYTW